MKKQEIALQACHLKTWRESPCERGADVVNSPYLYGRAQEEGGLGNGSTFGLSNHDFILPLIMYKDKKPVG